MGMISSRYVYRPWRLLADEGTFRERKRVRQIEHWLDAPFSRGPDEADRLRAMFAMCLLLLEQL
jgi:hypothetical protein